MQLGVRKAHVRDLRTSVRDLDRDVGRELPLQRGVPLLHVPLPEITVNREDPLPDAGIWCQRDWLHLGTRREREGRVMLSSVRCDTVWRNGKTGVHGVVIPALSIQTVP